MANIHPDIKPGGIPKENEVDLWRQLLAAIKGICAKLDDDGGVPLTTYEANVFTALCNVVVEDTKGNRAGQCISEENFYSVSPTGITDAARLQLMYQFLNMLETLTEQLDADVLTDSTYEALCYTALMLHRVEDTKGNVLGNGTTFYFKPGGVMNRREYVEFLYNAVNSIETMTEQLDADGTVTDTNYEALWFTATILTRVENAAGNVVGN